MALRTGRRIAGTWLAGVTAVALASQDPCLLTLPEARELGGSDTTVAGGGGKTCNYLSADSSPRVTIALFDPQAEDGKAALALLADAEKFAEKKNGKVRTWIAADRLEGWVLSGEVLASVSAPGEASSKRKRKLELAVFHLTEKLR